MSFKSYTLIIAYLNGIALHWLTTLIKIVVTNRAIKEMNVKCIKIYCIKDSSIVKLPVYYTHR